MSVMALPRSLQNSRVEVIVLPAMAKFSHCFISNEKERTTMRTEDTYGKNMKRNEMMESARMIRWKFFRYQQAEIIYSLSHKKLMELPAIIVSGL